MPIEIEQYWTTKQIAERVQGSVDGVKNWLKSGALRKTKIGGKTLITERDFQDFVRRSNEKSSRAAA